MPAKQPANDASGAAGWVWSKGTPGWEPGQTLKGFFNVSGLQPIEVQAAQLAAARDGLDANKVRVIDSIRGSRNGVLAILAAPTLYETPVTTCLAALLQGNAPVRWQCPGATPSAEDLGHSTVLVAAALFKPPVHSIGGKAHHPLYLVGVARGDVYKVVLEAKGLEPDTLYSRGATWGQFEEAVSLPPKSTAHLAIYGRQGLMGTLPLNVPPGSQRVLQ